MGYEKSLEGDLGKSTITQDGLKEVFEECKNCPFCGGRLNLHLRLCVPMRSRVRE